MKSNRRIRIVTNTDSYTYVGKMCKLEQDLMSLGFATSCRGILVNLQKVEMIKGYRIQMKNGIILPLSQRRVSVFKDRLRGLWNESCISG